MTFIPKNDQLNRDFTDLMNHSFELQKENDVLKKLVLENKKSFRQDLRHLRKKIERLKAEINEYKIALDATFEVTNQNQP